MRRFFSRFALGLTLAVATAAAFTAVAPHVAFAQKEGEQMKVLPQAELDVVKVLLAQERAWNQGNMEGFTQGYKDSPDILFLGHDVSRGFEGMAASYKKNYPDRATMGKLTFSDLEPHLLDDKFATMTGHFALERPKKNGGNVSGIFSLVLEKTAKGWKIILDHTTS
jgi:ketosteroid isomerase-like protein